MLFLLLLYLHDYFCVYVCVCVCGTNLSFVRHKYTDHIPTP